MILAFRVSNTSAWFKISTSKKYKLESQLNNCGCQLRGCYGLQRHFWCHNLHESRGFCFSENTQSLNGVNIGSETFDLTTVCAYYIS